MSTAGDVGPELASLHLTAPDQTTAEGLARALVEERLVACVNVIPGARSFYRWNGSVTVDDEWLLIAKTRAGLVERVCARVLELHPHEVPCVLSLPVAGGHRNYRAWVLAETQEP